MPDNVKNYIDNLDKKDSNPKLNIHDEETTDNYLNFNKNASLKARLFNKNSQLIISSLSTNTNENNNYSDILGTKDDFLNQILNSDAKYNKNNLNNTNLHANSLNASKILNNNTHDQNNNDNTTIFANNNINNILQSSHSSQNNSSQAGNLGDYNLLRSKINLNDFSLFNNNININEHVSTLSQHSKTSSVYGDEHHTLTNEDLLNNINNFYQGNLIKLYN